MLGDIGQLISGIANVAQAITNPIMQNKTNKHNAQMVAAQNAAAAAESEKAYERSKPTTQVTNMRQVGMSQAGAINALNGGGSYTPAPINVSQDQAPQLDVSGLTNVLMGAAQLKEQKRQFDKNLGLEKEKMQLEKEKFEEEKIDKGYNRVINQLQANILHSEDAIKNLDYLQKLSTHDEDINAQNAEAIARRSTAILEDIRSKRVVNAMSRMTDEELDNLFELQATLNMLQQGLQYDSSSAMIKGAKKLLSFLAGGKGAGKNIRMH